jgi:hypothetical protein
MLHLEPAEGSVEGLKIQQSAFRNPQSAHLPAEAPEIPKCQKNKKILNNRPQGNHGF